MGALAASAAARPDAQLAAEFVKRIDPVLGGLPYLVVGNLVAHTHVHGSFPSMSMLT
jgi:hypothetical protein